MAKLQKSSDVVERPTSAAVHATAFASGVAVMIVEIAGARSLAPFFGASLHVWTAQITATLLFLALGYRWGARLAVHSEPWTLPAAFWGAGLWLSSYALLRTPVLSHVSAICGVPSGSFLSASLLFGPPLLGLGAVSPLLVERMESARGAGFSAGSIFFTGTLGNLAGGWLTALLLIPHFSLRVSLLGTAVGLALLGTLWVLLGKKMNPAKAVLPALAVIGLIAVSPGRVTSFGGTTQPPMHVSYSQQSSVGLLQVMDSPEINARTFLTDGVIEGGMFIDSGQSFIQCTQTLNYLSWRYQPKARSALILGLGVGLLAKSLDARGVKVTAAELEPQVVRLARTRFGLPDGVTVAVEDGRQFVRRHAEKYDLIIVDVFAGESTPFYLLSDEAIGDMKNRLNPGGRLLVNMPARTGGANPGMDRLEAHLLRHFPQALVFVDRITSPGFGQVTNAITVAGENLPDPKSGLLPAEATFPGHMDSHLLDIATRIARSPENAKPDGPVQHDDRSDMDLVDTALRLEWRQAEMKYFGPEVLAD